MSSPYDVVPGAGMEVKLRVNSSALVRQIGGLHTQMLSVPGMLGDPAEEPVVALVPAWHLQSDHVMPSEEDHSHLGTFPCHSQSRADSNESKSSTEVRVVLQTVQEV